MCLCVPLPSQPQITVPDVIIWMLAGKNRVACKRIPAHKLMYAAQQMQRGELCGTIQTILLEVGVGAGYRKLWSGRIQCSLRIGQAQRNI